MKRANRYYVAHYSFQYLVETGVVLNAYVLHSRFLSASRRGLNSCDWHLTMVILSTYVVWVGISPIFKTVMYYLGQLSYI